jgi:hypothetical protein
MTDPQDHITASYIPPPPPAAGKILVKAPKDSRGYPIFPDLHLTVEQAGELDDAICLALLQYEDYEGNADA